MTIGEHGVLPGCTAFGGVSENGQVYPSRRHRDPGRHSMETVLLQRLCRRRTELVELGPTG